MRISDWSSDVCSSDLAPPFSCRRGTGRSCCDRRKADWHALFMGRAQQRRPGLLWDGPTLLLPLRNRPAPRHRSANDGTGQGYPCWRILTKRGYYFLPRRSEEHTSELQSLMRTSYAVFCLKKKQTRIPTNVQNSQIL